MSNETVPSNDVFMGVRNFAADYMTTPATLHSNFANGPELETMNATTGQIRRFRRGSSTIIARCGL
jgi:hypothetical protein